MRDARGFFLFTGVAVGGDTMALRGGVSEWLKETVLKTVVGRLTVGSNPTPSASFVGAVRGEEEARAYFAVAWASFPLSTWSAVNVTA